MPLYEYVCEACAHRFEELVSSHRAPDPACPQCAAQASKVFSSFAVGSGGPSAAAPAGCGSCGDPRGPGACRRAG